MARKLSPDKLLFATVVALALFGVVMVGSATAVMASPSYGPFSFYLIRQFAYALIGLAAMWLAMKYDYRNYRSMALLAPALALCLLMLVAVLVAPAAGARRWLYFGPLSLQPSEISKVVVVIFTAVYLDRHGQRLNRFWSGLLPCLSVIGLYSVLILIEPDLGTAATLALVCILLLFIGGLRLGYLAGLVSSAAALLALLISQSEYQKQRIVSFLSPFSDPLGAGYQIRQSLIAVGSGGLAGLGLGEGKQKLFFLPQPHTDFIYAVIGEELGLAGAALVLIGFLFVFWRGLRAAVKAPDGFGFYLACGLTLLVVVQALINMSVVLRLMPTKGIPLPFISLGGSSMLASMLAMGIVLNISQHAGQNQLGG